MQKLMHILSILYISTILFNTTFTQSMKQDCKKTTATRARKTNTNDDAIAYELTRQNMQKQSHVDAYNDVILEYAYEKPISEFNNNKLTLTSLPIDALSHFTKNKPLEESIKEFMMLCKTCQQFNQFFTFEAIGKICNNYSFADKQKLSQKIIGSIKSYDASYEKKRLPLLILITADTDIIKRDQAKSFTLIDLIETDLLEKLVAHNSTEPIQKLFLKKVINANIMYCFRPIFFSARTQEMAQLFIDNDAYLNRAAPECPNVLWQVIAKEYPSSLMELYLKKNVDAKKLKSSLELSCLLHEMVHHVDSLDSLKKAKLLLNAIPNMVNHQDALGRRPINYAKEFLNDSKISDLHKQLIALYELHTPITLPTQVNDSQMQKCSFCEITLKGNGNNHIPCQRKKHSGRICNECHLLMKEADNFCPLC